VQQSHPSPNVMVRTDSTGCRHIESLWQLLSGLLVSHKGTEVYIQKEVEEPEKKNKKEKEKGKERKQGLVHLPLAMFE